MSRKSTATGLGLLIAAAGVVFAALSLPPDRVAFGLIFVGAVALSWRRAERAPLGDPIQAGAVILTVGAIVSLFVGGDDDAEPANGKFTTDSASKAHHEAKKERVLTVYNRVTSGPRMREDDEPVYLSIKPVASCSVRACSIAGTARESGDTYNAAVCQRDGERVTNGQDTSHVDDGNPDLFQSRRFYGVRLADSDTFGYVSEVWVEPRDRGGLGLPKC